MRHVGSVSTEGSVKDRDFKVKNRRIRWMRELQARCDQCMLLQAIAEKTRRSFGRAFRTRSPCNGLSEKGIKSS